MRRFFCVLTAVLALLLPFRAADAEPAAYTGGDIDGDGVSSARDAALVLRAAAGHISFDNAESARADVTGNQTIGESDATAILLLATDRIGGFSDLVPTITGGLLGDRYLDRFAYRGTVRQGMSYRSRHLSISMRETVFENAVCYIADVYLQDVTSFRTAFSSGAYLGARQTILEIAAESKAVLAINGDLYTYRTRGPLVRNGQWYRTDVSRAADLCVLYRNGTLATYDAGSVTGSDLRAGDVYQTWAFGPRLLDGDGMHMTEFHCDDSILGAAARSAIGYYEPGRYVIVAVDGRANPASKGLTMPALSRLFESLGCKAAYNLYGGLSSSLTASGSVITYPKDLRTISDIICIAEPLPGGEGG